MIGESSENHSATNHSNLNPVANDLPLTLVIYFQLSISFSSHQYVCNNLEIYEVSSKSIRILFLKIKKHENDYFLKISP